MAHCFAILLSCAGGVSAAAAAWGSKWVQLLDWEESKGRARRADIWALTGMPTLGNDMGTACFFPADNKYNLTNVWSGLPDVSEDSGERKEGLHVLTQQLVVLSRCRCTTSSTWRLPCWAGPHAHHDHTLQHQQGSIGSCRPSSRRSRS